MFSSIQNLFIFKQAQVTCQLKEDTCNCLNMCQISGSPTESSKQHTSIVSLVCHSIGPWRKADFVSDSYIHHQLDLPLDCRICTTY